MLYTLAGRNFRVSKKKQKTNAKYLTKLSFGDFWKQFRGKNFREFIMREMLSTPFVIVVDDDSIRNKSLL